ncbi:MAG TPA: histidine phosphatase family protein [Arsenicitalea sp.]|jgi:probable phosphoglycerate mutase|nr:histidine phosphatase family protein [Arsenicitalea sp.]
MTKFVWPEIFFIRHGETPWNAERRYQGRRDIPLNATGQGQADENGVALSALFKVQGIDPANLGWYASPLSRTRETMQRVRAAFDTPLPEVHFDPRLVEISFGALEGLLHHELPAHLATAPGQREAGYWHFRPEEGENYADVAERITAFGRDLTGPSVIVAHGGVARTLRFLIEDAPLSEVVNWASPQDVILHFQHGVMEIIGGADELE